MSRSRRRSSSLRPTRREFLEWSAAAVVLPLVGSACPASSTTGDPPAPSDPTRPVTDPQPFDNATSVAWVPESVAADGAAFALPVRAGSMTENAVSIVAFTEDAQPKLLRIWRADPEPGHVRLAHESTVPAKGPGYLGTRVTGLAPDTPYSYAFFTADGAGGITGRSGVGVFRTAYPADYLWPVTLGGTSCTNLREAPWTALQLQATQPMDAWVHLGDFSYNDGAVTLDDYRAKWRRSLADPGYGALLPAAGMYATWDDHEFTNDLNPEVLGPVQMENAKQAFFEVVPQERQAQGQLWTSYRWGRTLEVFVMDCRSERKPSTRGTGMDRYISVEQLEWFKAAMLASPAHFRVVLNSVPVIDFPDTFWASQNDRWEGWRAARDELVGFLEQNDLRNTWFLSGDFHIGLVGRLQPTGFQSKIWEIAVGPGGNQGNPLPGLANSDPQLRAEIFPPEQFEYFSGEMAATTITFDPLRDEVRIRFLHGETQEVLFDRVLSQRS